MGIYACVRLSCDSHVCVCVFHSFLCVYVCVSDCVRLHLQEYVYAVTGAYKCVTGGVCFFILPSVGDGEFQESQKAETDVFVTLAQCWI